MMASACGVRKRGAIVARPNRACRRLRDRPCTSVWPCLPLQLGSVLPSFAARTLLLLCLKGQFGEVLYEVGRMLWLTQVLRVTVMRGERLQINRTFQRALDSSQLRSHIHQES